MGQGNIARRSAPRYEMLGGDLCGRTRYTAHIHLVDLSTRGALLEYHRYIKPDTILSLQLLLSGVQFKVETSVVHCKAHESGPSNRERTVFRLGVRFVDLDSNGKKIIQELFKERLSDERRKQPRLFVGRPAQIEEDIELRVINLGSKGGLFSVCYPLEFNDEHDFVFQLPSGEIRAHGVVRHCQAWMHAHDEPRFQIGVEFTDFQSDGETRVLDYLAKLEHEQI